jgi:hypothetical protein
MLEQPKLKSHCNKMEWNHSRYDEHRWQHISTLICSCCFSFRPKVRDDGKGIDSDNFALIGQRFVWEFIEDLHWAKSKFFSKSAPSLYSFAFVHSLSNFQIFCRNCTSKLSDFSDLNVLMSYGFRGEAVNSLCNLSESVKITTKTINDTQATTLTLSREGQSIR